MAKLKTQRDYKLERHHMEKGGGKSLTVPSEAYSLKEILQKYTSGVNLSIMRDGNYEANPDFDSDDLEKIDAVDITDRDEVLQRNADKIDSLSAKAEEEGTKRQSDKKKKEDLLKSWEEEQERLAAERKKSASRKPDLENGDD